MDLGEGTFITATTAQTRIRGGGYGATAWLARITGADPTYGLARQFVRADKSSMSGSGRSGVIAWDVPGPGVYEWRAFCVGSTGKNWRSSGFCVIAPDGAVTEIERDEALDLARDLDMAGERA